MGKGRRERRDRETTERLEQAFYESGMDDVVRREYEQASIEVTLPLPRGFDESLEQYLARCGLRLPFRDDKKRHQDPDCSCRGRREHYRHDHDCPLGVAYRRWDGFMQERWEHVRKVCAELERRRRIQEAS